MYDIPSVENIERVVIDAEVVKGNKKAQIINKQIA